MFKSVRRFHEKLMPAELTCFLFSLSGMVMDTEVRALGMRSKVIGGSQRKEEGWKDRDADSVKSRARVKWPEP